MSADSGYCQGVDRGSWSPGNIFGSFACGVSNVFDSTVGVVASEAGQTGRVAAEEVGDVAPILADAAEKGAGNAAFWAALSFPIGVGISLIGIGVVAVAADQIVLGGRYTGKLL